jgi:hypothetical protein
MHTGIDLILELRKRVIAFPHFSWFPKGGEKESLGENDEGKF